MMIRIKSQDALHQYDGIGRAITTWDGDRCAWIVNKEFEDAEIDWYGANSDFPGGMTLKEYDELYPDFANNPNITITWKYESINALVKTFGDRRYWEQNVKTFPYLITRNWNYFSRKDVPTFEAVLTHGSNGFHGYAGFDKGADGIFVQYDNEKHWLVKQNGKWVLNTTHEESTTTAS
jgi:hypothetical protein